MPLVALVSNQAMPINGRDYGSEDTLLAEELCARGLDVQVVLPETLLPVSPAGPVNDELLSTVDAVFCRNNFGGVLEAEYRAALDTFCCSHEQGWKVFNDFSGCRGDYRGKQHLLDLYAAGYPVIPSTVDVNDLNSREPFNVGAETGSSLYMVKSMTGADSEGIKKDLTGAQVRQEFAKMEAAKSDGGDIGTGGGFVISDPLLQPMVAFDYEVSFFFFENEFVYAMYNGGNQPSVEVVAYEDDDGNPVDADGNPIEATEGSSALPDAASDAAKRWRLQVYEPTAEDMAFAKQFVDWNRCSRQIQRVDACRLRSSVTPSDGGGSGTDGGRALLLMEVEDYNCWLSLAELQEQRPELFEQFMDTLAASLQKFVAGNVEEGLY
jgi:hypothetical protein